jgi:peptide/nickel transport system substrate-binding protein
VQLLERTGWKRGSDGIQMKGDQRIKVLYQTSVNLLCQRTQALVKKAFERIGIEVELKAVKADVYVSRDPGNPDTYAHFYTDIQMYSASPRSPDPQLFMQQFVT